MTKDKENAPPSAPSLRDGFGKAAPPGGLDPVLYREIREGMHEVGRWAERMESARNAGHDDKLAHAQKELKNAERDLVRQLVRDDARLEAEQAIEAVHANPADAAATARLKSLLDPEKLRYTTEQALLHMTNTDLGRTRFSADMPEYAAPRREEGYIKFHNTPSAPRPRR